MSIIAGVGDSTLGQWEEFTGTALHIRRRLSAEEQALVGDVVDCRGTEEWERRFDAMKPFLPAQLQKFALQERTK